MLTYNGSNWAPANASSGGASIYGDGSDGSVSVGSANWTTSAPSYTLQFQNFTVTGALTVPSGLIIRATGNVVISGSITVAPSPANTGTSSVQGISEQPASTTSAGLAYSAFQLRQLLKPGLNGGGTGTPGGTGATGGGGGGTLVFLAAGSITIQSGGSITANGTAGTLDATDGYGGGGGAGGVIILASKTSISNSGTITTNGGAGASGFGNLGDCANTSPPFGISASGGGGGGLVHFLAPSVTAGTATANGGAAGSNDVECGYGGFGGASGGNGGASGTTGSLATAGSAGVNVTTAVADPATLFLP